MNNANFADFKIFTGNAHPQLAAEIAALLGKPLAQAKVGKFSDGEISVNISETVRGLDVFIVQSTCAPVNDNLMELCIMIDAMKRASAGRINALIPYYGYARQDRKSKARDPITSKMVANILVAAGADRVITMDLHAPQIQGYFDIPVDHLEGLPILVDYFRQKGLKDDLMIVSPDHGSVGRTRTFAREFDAPIAIVDKRRPKAHVSEIMNIIGDVEDKTCILVDDMIDTAGTMCNAAAALKKMGAKEVYGAVTHAVLSGVAIDRLKNSVFKELVLLNTIPLPAEKMLPNMKVLSVAPLFADAIDRIHNNRPVSVLFEHDD